MKPIFPPNSRRPNSDKVITRDEMLASKFQFCDYVDELDCDNPAPVPGMWTEIWSAFAVTTSNPLDTAG
ncbi:MAG: hypothetical protein HQ582_24605 [Planctomycetes bacterium]|nr:hypothetical protein [Planctomycetota bacterium]